MKKQVSVIGHGYVGKQMARMLSAAHEVVAYDPDGAANRLWDRANEWRYKYLLTDNREEAQQADLVVICVPTPMADDGSCDTSIVREVCGWVDAPLVVIKSTVPPGFTKELNEWAAPARQVMDLPLYERDRFHFSPEYAGEPVNYVPLRYPDPRDSSKHDFCIVGGPRASEVLDYFAACMATSARYVATDSTTAELTKYMENAYFATKVMFCTEFAMIAQCMGVDYKELRDLWTLDSRVDPDHTMVFPDRLGFGGKCLPKDLSGIISAAEAAGYAPHLLDAVRQMNWRVRGEASAMSEAAE